MCQVRSPSSEMTSIPGASNGFDMTCTATIACIIFAVVARNRTRRVIRRAFRRARHIIVGTPHFAGNFSTVQSTSRVLRPKRWMHLRRYSAISERWDHDLSDESTPCVSRSVSESLSEASKPMLPIPSRRAKTCSAKLLSTLKCGDASTTTYASDSEDAFETNSSPVASDPVPSMEELGILFDDLKRSASEGNVDAQFMQNAVLRLRNKCNTCFQSSDGQRLFDLLSQTGKGAIDRRSFQDGFWVSVQTLLFFGAVLEVFFLVRGK